MAIGKSVPNSTCSSVEAAHEHRRLAVVGRGAALSSSSLDKFPGVVSRVKAILESRLTLTNKLLNHTAKEKRCMLSGANQHAQFLGRRPIMGDENRVTPPGGPRPGLRCTARFLPYHIGII